MTRRPELWWSRLPPFRRRLAAGGFAVGVLLGSLQLLHTGRDTACHSDGRITIAANSDVSAGGFRRDLVRQWNAKSKRTDDLVEISDSTDEARAEMAAAAQSHRCTYDIFLLDVVYIPEFARNGYLSELTPKEFGAAWPHVTKEVLRAAQVDRRQYAEPLATDAPLLFRKAGLPLPATWADLVGDGSRTGYAGTYGYVGQFDDYEGGTVNLMEAVLSSGAEITKGDKVVLDQYAEKTQNALAHLRGLLDGLAGDGSRPPGSGGPSSSPAPSPGAEARCQDRLGRGCLFRYREESSLQAFRDGDVGYMRNWPFAFPRLALDPSMRAGDGSPLFEVSHLPGKGITGGYALAISATMPEEERPDAVRLIRFLTSAEAQKQLFACGGYPPVIKEVYDFYMSQKKGPRTCSELQDREDPSPEPGSEMTAPELGDFATAIHDALGRAESRPVWPHYATFSDTFRSCARKAVTGEIEAREIDVDSFAEALRTAGDGRRPDDPCPG
ncbi:extracellular solute-binding protein [Microbispora triticiradicis]|uniref:Extracellular solute-binding protein n=2 Tax=Microbispora TaxID=2005 RepID=A0ABY3M551_9ACTN|nr:MULTISPECIES: extracellular solute-binding protein [Microbispora]TLP66707.1 extracellular solute-binding protein [Microbispora fusca]TYB67477.1 extracellular solute-binding protein [Microbispora tritici]